MSESIIIVGAGIAGLSAGCYGQMNGYQTQIFELHDKPGGLCTSWKRKGYTFDGCIHWLVGSNSTGKGGMNRTWRELGALKGRQIVDHDEFFRIEGDGGKTFVVYTNIDRLQQHMKELAPNDADQIDEFAAAAYKFVGMTNALEYPDESAGLFSRLGFGLKMLPYLGTYRKYSQMSVEEFAAGFSDPFLRDAFGSMFGIPDFPMMALFMTLAWMHDRDAGYPIGGSLEFARGIEQRYLDLGGQINYRSPVEKILVEDDRAVGIRLADGTEHRADVVISAADGHSTIFDMLEGRYADEKVRGYYQNLPIFRPVVQVSLGIKRDLSDQPHSVSVMLDDPIMVAGEEKKLMSFRHFCYDPTMAPAGKSAVVVLFDTDYAYWKEIYQERERYDSEKQQVAMAVIDHLEGRFPGLTGQVESVDVATPMTTERYTANWQGSMEGWLITTETYKLAASGMDKTLPGLDNFYMVGQWVEPGGGLPPAAQSGRNAIQKICKADGKAFQSREA